MPILPEGGGERCMLDKASLFPQLAGAKEVFGSFAISHIKETTKYCFVHLQCLQEKEI